MDTPMHHITLAHGYLLYGEASVDGYECREREITRGDGENVLLQLYDAEEALVWQGRGYDGVNLKGLGSADRPNQELSTLADSQVSNPRFI